MIPRDARPGFSRQNMAADVRVEHGLRSLQTALPELKEDGFRLGAGEHLFKAETSRLTSE